MFDKILNKCGLFHFDKRTNKLIEEPRNQYYPFNYDDMEW